MRGCSKVSDGCKNCYAERQAARFCGEGQPYHGLIRDGKWTGEARFVPEMLEAPLRRKEPSLVFVNSMSDLFHKDISDEQIAEVFGVIAVAAKTFMGPRVKGRLTRDFGPHVFQILTKRAERLCLLGTERFRGMVARAAYRHAMDRVDAGWLSQCISGHREYGNHCTLDPMWPLPNLHLGVSVENQRVADERIPLLLRCPAAVRWVSAEPLLGEVRLDRIDADAAGHTECMIDALTGRHTDMGRPCADTAKLDWVVGGSESGPNARPMHPEWSRSLRDQCKAAGVPYWFKQWGEWLPRSGCYHRQSDGSALDEKDPDCTRWPCVKITGLGNDGSRLENSSDAGDVVYMQRVGKKTAGNLLDGVRYEMRPGDSWK